MNEKEIRDDAASSKSKFGKSSSSEEPEEESSSSVEEESSSSMEMSKDAKSILGRWVLVKDVFIHKITDAEQCAVVQEAMSQLGELQLGEFSEYGGMMSENCEDREEPQSSPTGEKMLFYSDGSLDCLDGGGDLLGSYDYNFDESTGTITYVSGGETPEGHVSADGTTLIFETVTDGGYKTITHRVVFEKESGEIE